LRHLPYKIAIVAALAISLFYLKGGMAQVEPVTAEQTKTLLAPPLAAALGEPQARVSVIESWITIAHTADNSPPNW
jgi:hypothetical protein